MKLALSKNPEKESKTFAVAGLVCGVVSLLLWFVAITGLAFSVRGVILSNRVSNKKYLAFSVVGLLLSLISLSWYLVQ